MSVRNVIFHKGLKKCIAVGLMFMLVFAQSAFAFNCLSPKIKLEQLDLENKFESNIFLRNSIQENLEDVEIGACRTISLRLVALLYLDGYNAKIVLDDNHVWVETNNHVLDASMKTNGKLIKIRYSEPSLYAEWKSSGGVIRKDSELAKRFFYGASVIIEENEYVQMIENGVLYYNGNAPISLVTKINQTFAMIQKEKRMRMLDKEIAENKVRVVSGKIPRAQVSITRKYSPRVTNFYINRSL